MSDEYKKGDFNRICDVCGFKMKASETRMRWDGLIVCLDDWEPRHPQDTVRAKTDKQTVRQPRPETEDVFTTPGQITGDDL